MAHQHTAQVLQETINGYVIYCSGCKHYQLAFGTFCVSQNQQQLKQFADLIRLNVLRFEGRATPKRRDIQIDSPYPGFSLLFSLADLLSLDEMLQNSLLLIGACDKVRLS